MSLFKYISQLFCRMKKAPGRECCKFKHSHFAHNNLIAIVIQRIIRIAAHTLGGTL